jgi:translation initiation factor 3 subunit D
MLTALADYASYISRANPRDAQRHVIVGVQSYKPLDFARQMNVSLTNGWGIVRTIADLALARPEGKYVLVKDPNHVSFLCVMVGLGQEQS